MFFRESFQRIQCIGLSLLIGGLLLFFHERVDEFTRNLTDYAFGALLVLCSAATWASYALAQKKLLTVCSSAGIMMTLYAIGVVVMFPFWPRQQNSWVCFGSGNAPNP